MGAKHQEVYTMNATVQAIRGIILDQGFMNKLRIELKSENPTETGVWYRFHHGVSFTSWGEKITVTLTPLSPNVTQVIIHSECGLPTQVIDYGKNKQVVCNIYEAIEAGLRSNPVPQTQAQSAPAQTTKSFCGMCGARVTEGSKFCASCGAKLT